MVEKFNRSQFMKDRNELAKKRQKLYGSLNDRENETKIKYSDFLKKDNIVDKQIAVYYISTQVNYSSSGGGIYTDPKTFKVIALKSMETENSITRSSKNMFSNMVVSGGTFNPGFQDSIEKKTNVNFEKIRGLEEVDDIKLSSSDYDTLIRGDFVVQDLDKDISFRKNKKGSKSDKEYKGKLDMSGFL